MGKIKKLKTAEEYVNLANTFLAQGRHKKAFQYYKQALNLNPKHYIAWNNLGTTLLTLGKTSEARSAYKKALEINPTYADSLYSLGLIANTQDRLKEAVHYFEQALKYNPNHIKSLFGLGQTLRDLGKAKEAIAVITKAVRLDPSNFPLQYLLATLLRDIDQYKKAESCYKKAIKLNPSHARAWGDLATVYIFQNKPSLAQKALEKAISIDPKLPHLYFNLGMAFKVQDQPKKTIAFFKKILKLDPDFLPALQGLYFIKREICDWQGIAKLEGLLKKNNFDSHYTSILRNDSPAANLEVAKTRSLELEKSIPWKSFVFGNERRKYKPKIRLGYVSRDFRNHPVGQMVTPIFAHHNRNKFEIFIFAAGENDNSIWRKIAEDNDHFFDLGPLTHLETAKTINRQKIDILIDTTGPMTHNPMVASTLHPAPIQVSWMGVLGTSGASFYDYVIGDKTVSPFEERKYYSEKIVQLPCFSWINSPHQKPKKEFTRADFGLPEDKFIFAAFCLPQKIDIAIWKVWMDILKRIPNSVLWLWRRYREVEENLTKYAKEQGVYRKQLIFFEKLPLNEHLARIPLADLVLDTYIYQGAQTSSSILGSGVPLLTTMGNHYISRVSASMLNKLGIPELVAQNLEDYEEKAVHLALNSTDLIKIRQKLARVNSGKNSYPPQKFTKDLEKACSVMWERYRAGKKPSPIKVDS